MLEEYIRQGLQGFVNDPPDSPHQEGYLAALINVAVEGLSIRGDDPLVLAAANSTPHAAPDAPRQIKPKFGVIDGGKSD